MAVYVDSLFKMEAREAQAWHVGSRNGHQWCHMLADTEEELVQFAVRIGMRPAWLQRKPVLHFDLTPPRRERAVKLGAREITRRELVAIMRRQCGFIKKLCSVCRKPWRDLVPGSDATVCFGCAPF